MRIIVRIAIAAVTVLAMPGGAYAQSAEEAAVAKRLLNTALDQQKLEHPAARYTLVEAAQAYCEEIERIYPRNSPAEEAWLDTESKGSDVRIARVFSSAELGRRFASAFVRDCKASGATFTGGDKARALTAFAYSFLRFSRDANYYATKNGVDGKKMGFDLLPMVVEGFLVAALKSAPPPAK